MKSWRAWLLLIAFSLVGCAAFGIVLIRHVERQGLRNLQQSMTSAAWLLASGKPPTDLELVVRRTSTATGSRVRVLDRAGSVVADSSRQPFQEQEQLRFRPEVASAAGGEAAAYTRFADETDQSLALFVAVPADWGGVIYLSHTTDDILQQLGVARSRVVNTLFYLCLVLFAGSFYLSGSLHYTLRRMRLLTAQPDTLIPVQGNDEVAHIGENFNRLITSLQEKVSALEDERAKTRQFVEDVAHELKTPITVLCGSLETLAGCEGEARERLLGNLSQEGQRLSRLVARLLDLQKLDYYELQPELFDLVSLAETVVENAELEAGRKSITLSVTGLEQAPVNADPAKIRQVLENLLDNAIRCSPAGTAVEVNVEATPEGTTTRLLDRGPGIPAEDRERIFQRHIRASPEESPLGNMGLGLSIAWEALKKHGRELTVDARPGGGSVFRFSL